MLGSRERKGEREEREGEGERDCLITYMEEEDDMRYTHLAVAP